MPLPIPFRTITIRRFCLLYRRLRKLRSQSKIQISSSSLSCQTTPTTKTSTLSWRTRSIVTVRSSPSLSPTAPSRRIMTVSSWISSDRWMPNSEEIFGECRSAKKSPIKLCWLELMCAIKANRVQSDSVPLMTHICASITLRQALSLWKVRKLSRQLSYQTTSNAPSKATETSMERCQSTSSYTEMV